MQSLENQLDEWREAGLLDREGADRIAQYESRKKRQRSAQPVLIELFAYLGLIIVSAGVVLLVAVNWDRLAPWSRVIALAGPGLALLPAGFFLATASGPGGLRRGGSVSWLASLTLLVGAVAVAAYELGADPESTLLVAGTGALILAPALWLFVREHAQLVGMAAGAVLFAIGLAAFTARYLGDPTIVMLCGGAMIVLFATGTVLVRTGGLQPTPTAGVLSLLGLASGGLVFTSGLAGHFDGVGVPISYGLALMGLGLWGIVMTRLGLLIPRLLAGLLSEAGFAAATVFLAVGLAQPLAPERDEVATGGLIAILIAAGLVALTELAVTIPRLPARLLGSVGLIGGAYAAALPDGPVAAESLPLLVGAALVVLSMQRGTFVYMAAGLAMLFIGFVMPVARHVHDPTLAAIFMIVIGLAMLGLLALVVRYRPWKGHRPMVPVA